MAYAIYHPPPEVRAQEDYVLTSFNEDDLAKLVASQAQGPQPRHLSTLATTMVWGLANTNDSRVPTDVAGVEAAVADAGGAKLDRTDLTVEVQCLRAWTTRLAIEAMTGLPDGGALGANFRRRYASLIMRVQCQLPPTRIIDHRLDQYTRATSGESHPFSQAAGVFAAAVLGTSARAGVRTAVQMQAVTSSAIAYVTGVTMWGYAYTMLGPS